jgi:GINS complex subunit 1
MNEISSTADESSDATKVALFYYSQCYYRDRRYLLSYFINRLVQLRGLRWETGVVIPEAIRQGTLSPREIDYFSEYNEILNGYCDGIDLDLTADLQPPSQLFIEVLVLEECGELLTETGLVTLSKGSRAMLRRTDVEHLIRQGKCSHIQNDY